MKKKIASIALIGLISMGALSGCAQKSAELKEREQLQSQSSKKDSLELRNLAAKRDLEENPDTTRYVYIMNYGQIIGYYAAKGKISSSGSQIAPEQDLIKVCDTCSDRFILDSAKDDGSYGSADPGIFFWTVDGTMVETSLDYIVTTNPISLDVPRLGGDAPVKK
jgi:hypothetical protein